MFVPSLRKSFGLFVGLVMLVVAAWLRPPGLGRLCGAAR
jgi:hypothetical protein